MSEYTCNKCHKKMRHNVPRLGDAGGFVHDHNNSFSCEGDSQAGIYHAEANMTPTPSNGGVTAVMNFVQFTGPRNPAPKNMEVGEIIIRVGVSRATLYNLRRKMSAAMKSGMLFSIAQDGNMYTIKRDK